MKRSGNKILIIVLIIIAVLILAGGFAYAYFCTDIFRSGQELFVKYLTQDLEEISQTLSLEKFDQINEKISQSKYEEKMAISYLKEQETKPIAQLTLDTQKDNIDGKSYMYISLISKELENPLELEYMQENEAHSVRFTSISKKLDFVTVKNEKLKKLAENLGIDKEYIEEIPNKINFEEFSLEGLALSEAEQKEEINKYISVIYNNISKEKYAKNKDVVITINGKTITTNAYVLTLTEQDIKNVVIKILEETKKDEIILSKMNILLEKLQILDASMGELDEETLKEDYQEAIQGLIDGLKEEKTTEKNKIIITVYEEAGKTARIKLEQGMDYITLDTTEKEGKKQIDINFVSIDEDNTQLSYKVLFIKENNNKFKIQLTNIEGEEQETFELNIEVTDDDDSTNIDYNIINSDDSKISLSREIKFVDELEYKVELDDTNNIVLNDLTKEQMETIFGILEPRIKSSYLEKINPLTEESAIPMIALPVVALVVTEPNAAIAIVPMSKVVLSYNRFNHMEDAVIDVDLSEAEMSLFNSKFSMYEGKYVSTARVNALLTEVNAHNMKEALDGTERYISISGIISFTQEDTTVPQVENGKNYKVVCKYKDGLVNEIVIVNPEDEIPVDENNITTNVEGKDQEKTNFFSEVEKFAFNGKFEAYEGSNVSISDINALLNTVLSHNMSQEPIVIVTINEEVVLDENSNHINKISGTSRYKVECKYQDGIVTEITITENE